MERLNTRLKELLEAISKGDLDEKHQLEAKQISSYIDDLSIKRAVDILVFLNTAKIALSQSRIEEANKELDLAIEIIKDNERSLCKNQK